jgi:hypothetical protein
VSVSRRAPGGDPGRGPYGDETAPPGGGIFRRIAPSGNSSLVAAFSVLEGVFAPAAKQARDEIQRQRVAGVRNPSDTDPPAPDGDSPEPRVVAQGRRGTPFSGTILIDRSRDGELPFDQA